jgi:hypothetical protein
VLRAAAWARVENARLSRRVDEEAGSRFMDWALDAETSQPLHNGPRRSGQ